MKTTAFPHKPTTHKTKRNKNKQRRKKKLTVVGKPQTPDNLGLSGQLKQFKEQAVFMCQVDAAFIKAALDQTKIAAVQDLYKTPHFQVKQVGSIVDSETFSLDDYACL